MRSVSRYTRPNRSWRRADLASDVQFYVNPATRVELTALGVWIKDASYRTD